MQVNERSVVVTGAASGIGKAMALRFAREGARAIVLADQQAEKLDPIAAAIGHIGVECLALACDVAHESDIQSLVAQAHARFGAIDVFCSNAGIVREGDEQSSDELWHMNMQIHVMAHVYAARAVVPIMLKQGGGYLVQTASAAGLLTSLNSATYAVSKHAAIAFAEWLAIRYGDQGIKVSVLCPQGVKTAMTAGRESAAIAVDGMLEADEVAACVVDAMADERFLILPHPKVLDYFQRKASDYDRWLSGMRRFASPTASPKQAPYKPSQATE